MKPETDTMLILLVRFSTLAPNNTDLCSYGAPSRSLLVPNMNLSVPS